MKNKEKVFIGLSGGVDSAVSAALLRREGYDVRGIFIKVWQPDWMECNWREDRLDAMRVAAALDIPFATLDLEKEYKRDVVDYMIAEYRVGRTPNPDVMCNKSVKFGGFYDWAMKNGADFVATGHYARSAKADTSVEEPPQATAEDRGIFQQKNVRAPRRNVSAGARAYKLLAGKDANKDQSYFLWSIRAGQLPHILFPVGAIEKPEVRKLAEKFKLPNADKKDSQGLCFIGKVDIKEFLSHYIKPKEGKVLDENGNVVGHHDGAFFLTIGERHGFIVDAKTPHDEPYFVVGKDVEENTITVSHRDTNGFLPSAKMACRIEKTNWLVAPEVGKRYSGRARYRQPLEELVIQSLGKDAAEIGFIRPQNALTPGQSLVVYDGEVCMGGGIIL